MSISRRGQVTPLSPTFPNINLTKAIRNLLVVSNITKNDCNNLFSHPYTFNER